MAIIKEELEKYASTLSVERLLSFKTDDSDTVDMLIQRYKTNLLISQALYPELSTLEITLRNAIACRLGFSTPTKNFIEKSSCVQFFAPKIIL